MEEATLTTKDLPRETLALVASFLTLDDKLALSKVGNSCWWKQAIVDGTRHASVDLLDSAVGNDADAFLRLIQEWCPLLETFELHVPINLPPSGRDVELNGELLGRAMARCCETLKIVRLFFGSDKWSRTQGRMGQSNQLFSRIINDTDDLQALAQCRALKYLELCRPTFQSMQPLAIILKPSLVILKLDYLSFGRWGNSWRNMELFTNSIRQMSQLQQLSLIGHNLVDKHIQAMLAGPSSKSLKSLALPGPRVSGLGDISLQAIADNCRSLENLDFFGNQKATTVGWEAVLRNCPLKSVSVARRVHKVNIVEPVKLSPTLLVVWCDKCALADATGSIREASGGRVLIGDYYENTIQPSIWYELQQNESMARIKELEEKQKLADEQGEVAFYWAGSPGVSYPEFF